MANVANVVLNNRSGAITTPAVSIPDTAISGEIVLTGPSVTDPTVRLSIMLDFSPDGGVTWASTSPGPAMVPFPGVMTEEGGPLTAKGQPRTQIDIASPPFPAGTNRKVRGTFIFDGNPFNGSAAINLT
jgi:hypothetical protein